MKQTKTKFIIKIAILSALAFLLMLFDFPLPLLPPFYKIDLSEVIVVLGGIALGPLASILIEALKILLMFILRGSSTAGVGELANFIMGCAFTLPIIYVYTHLSNRKGLTIGMICGILTLIIVGALTNYFILLPIYSYFYHLPLDDIIQMGRGLSGNVTNLFTFVMFMTIPFNLIKGIISCLIVSTMYKKIIPIIKK